MSVVSNPPFKIPRGVQALIASPIVVLLASATRLIIVANYDTTTATTIAASSGVVGTLLGTTVPLLPPFMPVITVAFAIFRRWLLFSLSALATALISPAYTSAPAAFTAARSQFGAIIHHVTSKEWSSLRHDWLTIIAVGCAVGGFIFAVAFPHDALRSVRVLWALVVAGICALTVLFVQNAYRVPFDWATVSEIARRPWLPPEEIVTKDPNSVVGYTLSASEKWQVVLRESDRTISYIRSDDVIARRVCRVTDVPPVHAPLVHFQGAQVVAIARCRRA